MILRHFNKNCHFTAVPGFPVNLILILVPTTRNQERRFLLWGKNIKPSWLFLAPSFCMVGSGSFVPGPFLVGFGGMKVGMSMVHLPLYFPNLTVPSIYSRTEPHCKLPCQTSAKNLSLNSIAICAIMAQTLWQDDVALVSRCCADIECNRSKKAAFFWQETVPCIHGPSLYVWMPAVVVAVLIAYDYECAKELSVSLFLGFKNKHFWLRGCGPSLYLYIYLFIL